MNLIADIRSVSKSYGPMQVIRQCSLKLYEGEIYGLLGVNGAGKTTLMKIMLGLQQADSGTVTVLGRTAGNSTEYLSSTGSMIEYPVFYEHLNASENLAMHLCCMQKTADIAKTLQLVGLEHAGTKPVSQYSLGMKQRLGLARAVIHRPRLLILDEPLNGLDPVAIAGMRSLLGSLAREGMSILLSSHIIAQMQHTADRIGILSGGCISREFSLRQEDGEKAAACGEQFEDEIIRLMKGESA